MINGKRVTVVMPAYNAEKTLEKTHNEIPHDIVDDIILTDDASQDRTADIARKLNIKTFVHMKNKGYGGNQKTCYQEALRIGSDIIIMLHPDYQYTPKLITAMASMIAYGVFDAIIASRILGNKAVDGGMPLYKYISNRFLTAVENFIIQQKLSEYHTGYRAFSAEVLKEYEDVLLEHMYVDNCAMQLVREPKQFDVIVTTNMFGDILSDEASMLTGSIGMLPSASIGGDTAMYEPIHGSAPDIAGMGLANPLATILSVGMMFKYSFDREEVNSTIEFAVESVLDQGFRTRDIMSNGMTEVGTEEMGDKVVGELEK